MHSFKLEINGQRRWAGVMALAFGLMAGYQPAYAQAAATGVVTQLYVDKSGNFARVVLDSAPINPGNCPSGDYYIVEFPSSSARGPMMAALFLAMQQRTAIKMWINGCTAGQYWGSTRPAAQDVYVTP